MSDPLPKDDQSLEALRREIDAVDAEMHRLLMRRGEVIEQLIAAKRAGPTGSAFRPDREAAMLARLAERHSGVLPLATVEHVWREIIGTFTQLQAPFGVHAVGAGDPAMRDLLRFHFGFSATLIDHDTVAELLSAIRDSAADLGVVPLDQAAPGWWSELAGAGDRVKIIAALPFLTRQPDWPRTYVLGPVAIANPTADTTVYLAGCAETAVPGPLDDSVRVAAALGGQALLEGPDDLQLVRAAIEAAGLGPRQITVIGEYCAPPAQS